MIDMPSTFLVAGIVPSVSIELSMMCTNPSWLGLYSALPALLKCAGPSLSPAIETLLKSEFSLN